MSRVEWVWMLLKLNSQVASVRHDIDANLISLLSKLLNEHFSGLILTIFGDTHNDFEVCFYWNRG
jgi:hypothetical protein